MKTRLTSGKLQKSSIFFVLVIFSLILISLTTLNTSHAATTLYVNGTSGNDTYDGTSPTWVSGTIGPKKTIQNASNAVDPSGTVNVASGTYNEHIMITKNLSLIGASRDATIINGTNNGRGLYIAALNVIIANFTIQNCAVPGTGGAIANLGTLYIINCYISGSTAGAEGGAVYNMGTLNINNSSITGSNGLNGGAIYNYDNTCTLTVINTSITGNTATQMGGAIFNNEGTTNIFNSTITGNNAPLGGAIFNNQGMLTMHFNHLTGNSVKTIYTTCAVSTENNWWGSNSNPSNQFTGSGTVNYSPWIYMNFTANPTLILNGTNSILTANFNNAYDGTTVTPLNPVSGHIPDNTVVTFTTDLGSVGSHTTTKNTTNGIATATLTADEGIGTANITAQLDSQTLTTTVEITNTLYVNGDTGDDKYDGLSPTFISGTKTGPMQTITNALETLKTTGIDGTINVASGTYTENLAIETNTNLIGNNTNNTIITTPDPNNTIINIGKIKKALITGFTIQGASNGIGVLINGGEITIQNNNIFNNDIGIGIKSELKPSTITQNNIKHNNIGISTLSNVNVNFNSILDNNIDVYADVEDPINATHNWWGSNSDPSSRVSGNVNVNPWLILTVNATPTLIKKDATSSITANLNHNSNGDLVTSHIINGTPITFTTTIGTINSPQYTQNSTTNTTLHGGSVSGTADITTTLDNEEIHTPVTVDATTPTVTSTNPAQYAVNLPSNQVFTVTFSEAIKAANLNLIVLKTSTGTVIPTTKTIASNVLTITPNSPLSEAKYLLLVYVGSVTDIAGNPAAALSRTYGVGAQPYVTSTDPTNYATNVPRNKVITATFNEPILAKYLTLIYLKTATGGIQIATTKSVTGNTLTITPTTPLAANTRYMVLIYTFAVTDLAGNSNVNKAFTFTTGAT